MYNVLHQGAVTGTPVRGGVHQKIGGLKMTQPGRMPASLRSMPCCSSWWWWGWAHPAPVDEPVAGSLANLTTLEDEDWSTAVVDIQLLLDEDVFAEEPPLEQPLSSKNDEEPHQDWVVLPWVPPPPPDTILLPRNMPPVDFVNKISELRASGLEVVDTVEAAANCWTVPDEEKAMLRLAVQLVAAARQMIALISWRSSNASISNVIRTRTWFMPSLNPPSSPLPNADTLLPDL